MKDLQFLPEKVSSKVAKELFEKFQEYERIYQKVFAGMWSGVYCQVWCMQKILQLKILVLQIMWELQYQQSSGVLSTNFDEVVWRDGICVTGNSWLAVIWIMTRIQEFLTAFLLLQDKGKCKNFVGSAALVKACTIQNQMLWLIWVVASEGWWEAWQPSHKAARSY